MLKYVLSSLACVFLLACASAFIWTTSKPVLDIATWWLWISTIVHVIALAGISKVEKRSDPRWVLSIWSAAFFATTLLMVAGGHPILGTIFLIAWFSRNSHLWKLPTKKTEPTYAG